MLVPDVGAKDVFVPVIGRRAMLHDEGRYIHLPRQNFEAETASLAIQIRIEFLLACISEDVRRGEDDLVFEPRIDRRQHPHEPNFSFGSLIPGRNEAEPCALRAEFA